VVDVLIDVVIIEVIGNVEKFVVLLCVFEFFGICELV